MPGTTFQVEVLFLGIICTKPVSEPSASLMCGMHTELPLHRSSLGPVMSASLVGVVLSTDVTVLVSM